MDKPLSRITKQVQKYLIMLFLFSASFSYAQNLSSLSFQVNFVDSDVKAFGISFRQDNNVKDIFDFVILQHGEEIFRFRNFDSKQEELHSLVLVNDKNKALENLKTQATLTKKAGIEADLLAAYEDKTIAFIGILESHTANGAATRLQIVKMVNEDDETILSEVRQK